MKLVYRNEDRAIVYSVKNVLELHNIHAQIKNEYGHTMGAEFGLANSLLELWLSNDAEYDRARSIIDTQVVNPPHLQPWVCSQCGETNEGNFQACWKCQHERPTSEDSPI
jgi:hypothetical protein